MSALDYEPVSVLRPSDMCAGRIYVPFQRLDKLHAVIAVVLQDALADKDCPQADKPAHQRAMTAIGALVPAIQAIVAVLEPITAAVKAFEASSIAQVIPEMIGVEDALSKGVYDMGRTYAKDPVVDMLECLFGSKPCNTPIVGHRPKLQLGFATAVEDFYTRRLQPDGTLLQLHRTAAGDVVSGAARGAQPAADVQHQTVSVGGFAVGDRVFAYWAGDKTSKAFPATVRDVKQAEEKVLLDFDGEDGAQWLSPKDGVVLPGPLVGDRVWAKRGDSKNRPWDLVTVVSMSVEEKKIVVESEVVPRETLDSWRVVAYESHTPKTAGAKASAARAAVAAAAPAPAIVTISSSRPTKKPRRYEDDEPGVAAVVVGGAMEVESMAVVASAAPALGGAGGPLREDRGVRRQPVTLQRDEDVPVEVEARDSGKVTGFRIVDSSDEDPALPGGTECAWLLPSNTTVHGETLTWSLKVAVLAALRSYSMDAGTLSGKTAYVHATCFEPSWIATIHATVRKAEGLRQSYGESILANIDAECAALKMSFPATIAAHAGAFP